MAINWRVNLNLTPIKKHEIIPVKYYLGGTDQLGIRRPDYTYKAIFCERQKGFADIKIIGVDIVVRRKKYSLKCLSLPGCLGKEPIVIDATGPKEAVKKLSTWAGRFETK